MNFTQSIVSIMVFIMLIITVPIILVLIYIFFVKARYWIIRKITLFVIAMKLIFNAKDKSIRAIGWSTLSIVFWESKE